MVGNRGDSSRGKLDSDLKVQNHLDSINSIQWKFDWKRPMHLFYWWGGLFIPYFEGLHCNRFRTFSLVSFALILEVSPGDLPNDAFFCCKDCLSIVCGSELCLHGE